MEPNLSPSTTKAGHRLTSQVTHLVRLERFLLTAIFGFDINFSSVINYNILYILYYKLYYIYYQNTHSINCIPPFRSFVPFHSSVPELLHGPCSAYISWINRRIFMFKVSKQPYWSYWHAEIDCRWRHNPPGGENLN